MRRRMTHIERAQRAIARNRRKIDRINTAIPCASGKRLATLEERKKRAEKLIAKWKIVLGATYHPKQEITTTPKPRGEKTNQVFAFYSGKVVDMGYVPDPKRRFSMAGMRVLDNARSGYIIDGRKIYSVSRAYRLAKILPETEASVIRDEVEKIRQEST